MRIQPIKALVLLAAVTLAAPAGAQNIEGLYGRWEPASTSSGAGILWLEPGYWTRQYDGNQFVVEKFDVIKEFDGRMVVRMWDLGDGAARSPDDFLVIFDVADPYRSPGQTEPALGEYYCSFPQPRKFIFQDTDAEAIWARILEWSGRSGEGFPYNECNVFADGSFDSGWSSAAYVR